MSYREQHDAEFTSYIEKDDSQPAAPWQVVYKGVTIGFYRTREEARVKIRSLKPFSRYRPLTREEHDKLARVADLLEVEKLPWNRLTAVLRGLVYDHQ